MAVAMVVAGVIGVETDRDVDVVDAEQLVDRRRRVAAPRMREVDVVEAMVELPESEVGVDLVGVVHVRPEPDRHAAVA
jgi:hypothetical protein